MSQRVAPKVKTRSRQTWTQNIWWIALLVFTAAVVVALYVFHMR